MLAFFADKCIKLLRLSVEFSHQRADQLKSLFLENILKRFMEVRYCFTLDRKV